MKPNVRSHNLQVKQPNTQDYTPKNDGYETDIVDQSDPIRIGVQNGKEGSVSSKNVASYSKSHG